MNAKTALQTAKQDLYMDRKALLTALYPSFIKKVHDLDLKVTEGCVGDTL